jgi:type 1 glutamine amidotransferase
VLDNTTGQFLDDPNDAAATAARRKALLDFVRSGRGLAGIHAASDSYHAAAGSTGGAPARTGPAAALVQQIVTQGDSNRDQKLNKAEIDTVADAWFDKMDTAKTGRLGQQEFATGLAALLPAPSGPPAPAQQVGTWPEFNKMIGGFFKFHWNDPQHIFVKIDDPKSPLNAPFDYKPFEINDETYTFAQDSFSRDNCHVLTSVDYSKMSDEDKAKEPAATKRTDGDYALSWIRREGNGRVFYEAHGHSERVYGIKPMLGHYMAGIQYAIGDLKADDRPSSRGTR